MPSYEYVIKFRSPTREDEKVTATELADPSETSGLLLFYDDDDLIVVYPVDDLDSVRRGGVAASAT